MIGVPAQIYHSHPGLLLSIQLYVPKAVMMHNPQTTNRAMIMPIISFEFDFIERSCGLQFLKVFP
jgi:hypothetical protein